MKLFSTEQNGMTLLEVVIAVGIFTVLSLVITASAADFYRINSYTIEQTEEIENARRGMTQWNRDVKEVTSGEDGSFPIVVIDQHRFGYFSDTDQDDEVEYIEYILASTTLRKFTYSATGTPSVYNYVTPEKTEILSLYVQNINQGTSTFLYYDNAGNSLSSTSPVIDVRYIRAQFIINIDQYRSPGEFMLRSSIAPRNLKDNL